MFFSKEISSLISKGMSNEKIKKLIEKLTFSKPVGKINSSERKFDEMDQFWRAKRYKAY